MTAAPSLGSLLAGIATLPPSLAAHPAGDLHLDSRAVRQGDVFVALPGSRAHGADHAAAARAAGAALVLLDPEGLVAPVEQEGVVPVPGLRSLAGELARRRYGEAAAGLRLIGVTGTNGKTSCVQLLAAALSSDAGLGPCGHVGTLGIGLGDWSEPGERTTPDVFSLHRTLARLRQRGARSVAMEVSSHALDQGRVQGLRFTVAAFTNLSRDHLDYHGSMEAYGAAKERLFHWPGLEAAVIHVGDAFGRGLAERLRPEVECIRVGEAGSRARLELDGLRCARDGLVFTLREGGEQVAVRARLLGRFNALNLLVVAGCLRALGLPLARTASVLATLPPVRGRMQCIPGGPDQPLVVVDYAHTPDALEQALLAVRAHVTGKVHCVFGCGGERDAGKRPLMGAVAERLADRVVVTDDNPRGEDGADIVAAILAGMAEPARAQVVRDRGEAIATALSAAAAGDAVLIAGKGHETWQESREGRRPFDDAAVAAAWLAGRAA